MRFLRWLIDTESGKRIEHPVLGEAVYIKAKLGSYWEVETEVAGHPFTLVIDAENQAAPTEAQVAFFQRFADEPESAFAKVATALVPAYERWTNRSFPVQWQNELAFVGMSIPRTADDQSNYELSFEGPQGKKAAHFACSIVNGGVANVEVST